MESRKMVLMNLFAEQHWRHREQTYGQGQGEEGEGGMHGESTIETYIQIRSDQSRSRVRLFATP